MKVFKSILYLESFLTIIFKPFSLAYIYNSNPILLFPGLGGSRLIKTGNSIQNINEKKQIEIWPPTINYFMFNYKDWAKNIKIEYNEDNNKLTYDSTVQTLEFGNKKSLDLHTNLPYIFRKNFYDDIIDSYDKIYPIPYDFRLLHSEKYLIDFNNKLCSYIENLNEPVILLTHSCGGLISHNFLLSKDNDWKNKYIKCVINVNVPFGGLIVALEESVFESNHNKIIGKDIIQSIGGIIINQPNKQFFKSILKVDGKEIDDYYSYFKLNKLKKLYDLSHRIRSNFVKSNNIKTHIIYTSNLDTPESIEFNNSKINIINGSGDGVVPLCSLLVPKIWNHSDIQFSNIDNYHHSDIFFSSNLKDIINKYLS